MRLRHKLFYLGSWWELDHDVPERAGGQRPGAAAVARNLLGQGSDLSTQKAFCQLYVLITSQTQTQSV